jgi:hypothetical protein
MDHSDVYEICIEDGPHALWQTWFEGVELLSIQGDNHQPDRSLLVVAADDPGTLFGILVQIGSLNLRLISVELRPKRSTANGQTPIGAD